jgi:DNA transformation protein
VAAGLDPEYVQELFAAFGPVSVRRMFGGAGVYADGIMFALIANRVIYLKTAPEGTDAFERERCGLFTYAIKDGTRQITSYWQMPDRLYDDPDDLAQWARTALAAARAGQAKKARPKRQTTPQSRSVSRRR